MRELLLAHALDACITAERRVPGSADLIIARQPAWARTELRRLVTLASSLDAVATNAVMSEEFRVSARARLMHRIGGDVPGERGQVLPVSAWLASVPSRNGYHTVARQRPRRWMWRGAVGGLLASALALAATLTASANSLPGEPLYSVKQASEELGVRLAPDDQARALALLSQANTRLDETARLLQEGRTDQVAQTTQRFDEVVNQATTTFVVTIADAPSQDPTTAHVDSILSQQQQHIEAMLSNAPQPAQAELEQALVAAQHSRALVADAESTDRAQAHIGSGRTSVAAVEPTVAAEQAPVVEAEAAPTVADTPATPVVKRVISTPLPIVASDQTDRNGRRATTAHSSDVAHGERHSAPAVQASAPSQPAAEPDADADDSTAQDVAPPVVANVPQSGEHGGRGSNGGAGRGATSAQSAPPSAPSAPSTENHAGTGDEDVPVPGAARGLGNAAAATHDEQSKISPPPVVSQPERSSGDARSTGLSNGAHAQATPVATVTVNARGGGDAGHGRGGSSGSGGSGGASLGQTAGDGDHSSGNDHGGSGSEHSDVSGHGH